jgi:hypothetical protein
MLGNWRRVQGLVENLLLEPVTDIECDILTLLLDGFYPSLLSLNHVCRLFSASPVLFLAWDTIERTFCGLIPGILSNPLSSAAATLAIVS